MLKRLRKNHPLGYCVGAEVLFLGSLVLTSILVVFLLIKPLNPFTMLYTSTICWAASRSWSASAWPCCC